MEKEFIFVYLTTNLINGKQYIGDHSSYNVNDNYLGSGDLLKKKINEYGKENFKREILEFFNTREEAFNAQEKYINEYKTLAPFGYNLSPKGGHNVKGCFSADTKKKFSNLWKGRKRKQSSIIKGKQSVKRYYETHNVWNKGTQFLGNKNPMFGKNHSNESIEKMKKAKSGENNPSFNTCWIYNTELKQCKKIKKSEIDLYQDWVLGRKMKFN